MPIQVSVPIIETRSSNFYKMPRTQQFNISERQNSIVFGHLLGDGYLYKDGRLQVEQSVAKKNYVFWLHQELKNLSGEVTLDVPRVHPVTLKPSHSCRFYTKKCFTELESIFYEKNSKTEKRTKIVPSEEELEKRLDPVSLAVWFMDDGGKAQNTPSGAYINVSGFVESDQIKLQEELQKKFALKTNIHKAGGNNQRNLYIPADSYKTFYEIVSPTVLLIPDMSYKLSSYKVTKK